MEEIIFQKNFGLLFFSSLFLSLVLTPRTRGLAALLGAVDAPDPRKIHAQKIPRLGGLGIAVSVILFLLLLGEKGKSLNAFLVGVSITAMVGFLDDVFHFKPHYKFLGQAIAAAAFVFLGDCCLRSLGDLAGVGEIRLGVHAPWFTVFCMVGVMNALNLSDGLDGLAGGISAIACFFLGIFAILQRDWLSLAIVISLLGSLFGFLRYNTFPAKLFMGDTGSMLLGFSLAAVAVRLVESGGAVRFHPVTIVTVLALPILDTLRVMGRRALRRENPFRPDKTHLHHQLLALGFSHAAVVPILYGITAAFGGVAWAMRDVAEWVQFVGALALGACVYGTLFLCQRMGIRVPGSLREGTRYPRRPLPVWVRTWLGKSVPLASWLMAIGLCVPALLSGRVSAGAGLVAFGMASFVVVLFPWQSRRKHTAVCYGLSYSSCACLLGILHLLPGAYPWVEGYLAAFTASVLVWALLMMSFRPAYSRILVPTGFETLLIGLCFFIPLVLVPALELEGPIRRATLVACVESIPLLLAFKIMSRRKPGRNPVFAAGFLIALLLLGMRGTLPVENLVARTSFPAKAQAAVVR